MIGAFDLLFLEIDQIFVVFENLNVCECSPGVLELFSRDGVLRLLSDFSFAFLITSPSPLDLDGSDVIHCKPMVLEQPSRQRHFVSGLDQPSAEVSHACVLILVHHVER